MQKLPQFLKMIENVYGLQEQKECMGFFYGLASLYRLNF